MEGKKRGPSRCGDSGQGPGHKNHCQYSRPNPKLQGGVMMKKDWRSTMLAEARALEKQAGP